MQRLTSSTGRATPPGAGSKPIAPASQDSAQLLHTTARNVRQSAPTDARTVHGAARRSSIRSDRGAQTSTHWAQKIHSPRLKFTSGKPPRPRSRIALGQLSIHASHRLQHSVNCSSESAQGGRKGRCRPRKSPRRNCNRLTEELIVCGNPVARTARWAGLFHPSVSRTAANITSHNVRGTLTQVKERPVCDQLHSSQPGRSSRSACGTLPELRWIKNTAGARR